jgi:cell division protein FtsI (penicillin-binding protein 3)
VVVIERRIGLLFACFLALFTLIMARAVWLQGVRGPELRAQARGQQSETVIVPGHRGRILDRRGRALAVSEDAASVYATPYQVEDPAQTAARLAPLLGVSTDELLASFADRSSGFAYLKRQVDSNVAERIRRMGIAGIGLLPDTRRVYPQGEVAAQVIGAVGVDNQGLNGLERGREDVVGGENGEREVVKDANGEPLELDTIRSASPGSDLQLTLDATLQARTEEVLSDLGITYRPKSATAIVMDPRSAEVLAMANWPQVDPTDIAASPEEDLANKATGFTYEPGSTFKAFTVAGALAEGLVSPESRYDLPPTIQVSDREIEESHERGTVNLSVAQILAQSSNVGAGKVGLALGAERFSQWVDRLGFGEATGVGFPGEERGIVPSLDEYSGSSIGNLPIGQGLAVTPIQMAAAYAAIANGGILRKPRLVLEADGERLRSERGRRVLSARVAGQVRSMLVGVLEPGGTAPEVSVPGYQLAGKTGTSEKPEGGGYSEFRYVASFVGFAPAHRPSLLVAVMVDEPQGSIYGGKVAAPAFGEIARFALPYLRIPPG